jgi:alpha-beta hydrolase superfamily lysophospholipase
MSRLKKRIRQFMVIISVLILLLVGAVWVVTTPSEYPYPESVDLAPVDQKIEREYEQIIIECADDYEGRVIATLLSKKLPDSLNQQRAILYIHGYGDYFFQDHMTQPFMDEGYNFYALDLRKHGRSWLPHQRPCFSKSLTEYYEEIDQALEIIQKAGNEYIVLHGHSNGGLISSLYAEEGNDKKRIDALVLNSPFLDWPVDPALEKAIYAMGAVGRLRPYGTAPTANNPLYGYAIHKDFYGEWDYTTAWKPHEGFPKYLGWAESICEGQDKVAKGLNIEIPVLVLHSDSSFTETTYNEAALTSDAVLNVEHIKRLAPQLGSNVQLMEIPNAIHDIFLSKKEVREEGFKNLINWLAEF